MPVSAGGLSKCFKDGVLTQEPCSTEGLGSHSEQLLERCPFHRQGFWSLKGHCSMLIHARHLLACQHVGR